MRSVLYAEAFIELDRFVTDRRLTETKFFRDRSIGHPLCDHLRNHHLAIAETKA